MTSPAPEPPEAATAARPDPPPADAPGPADPAVGPADPAVRPAVGPADPAVAADPAVPAEPPPELRFRRRARLRSSIAELVRRRALIATLAEREYRVRYKQAVLGAAWAVITPLLLMVVFSLFFQRVARVETGDAPYALFAYLGLLPWTFFSTSVSQGGQSLIFNVPLLNKVRCPREVFPIASTLVAGLDFLIGVSVLGVLFVVFGFVPRPQSVWVVALLPVQLAFTLGVTTTVAAVVIYFRDLRHALTIILQLGLFATPVAYGIEAVPPAFRAVYSAVNPLAPVIDGYRRAVLLGRPPDWPLVVVGAVSSVAVMLGGYWLFKRLEKGMADLA